MTSSPGSPQFAAGALLFVAALLFAPLAAADPAGEQTEQVAQDERVAQNEAEEAEEAEKTEEGAGFNPSQITDKLQEGAEKVGRLGQNDPAQNNPLQTNPADNLQANNPLQNAPANTNPGDNQNIDLSDKNCWLVNGVPTMWSPAMHSGPGIHTEPCYYAYGLNPH